MSDPNCTACRETYNDIKKIVDNNKDEMQIGYSYFSDNISLLGLVQEAASRQDRFWECHQLIMENPISSDTTYYYNLLSQTGIDLDILKKDMNSPDLEKDIKENFKKISQRSIYGTPTFIMNNKIITKEVSLTGLDYLIKEAIKNQ
ncbi:thioredoxin domain-containing protein [Ancylomarina euxinus]|uniref:DsbA family protein n=1 Tax=Ancylomarina euxinus TaxID=2283627 RepID=UPI001CDCF36F|nr:thioredoxin domain-containing protein [Ancylomarina euxinus]MCZ4695816.1 thioredoxin domain-containing protein [Ancylomarina euxinus]